MEGPGLAEALAPLVSAHWVLVYQVNGKGQLTPSEQMPGTAAQALATGEEQEASVWLRQ